MCVSGDPGPSLHFLLLHFFLNAAFRARFLNLKGAKETISRNQFQGINSKESILSNQFQGIYSASLCSLAGRYANPIPTRFLAPIDCLKIPALVRVDRDQGI